MGENPPCFAAGDPADDVVGVAADVGDGTGRRKAGVVAPGVRDRGRARVLPAVDDAPDVTQGSCLDDLAGPRKGRDVACPEGHVVSHAGVADGRPHPIRLVDVDADRFFTKEVLAGRGGGQHRIQVQGIGGQYQHEVHLRMVNHLSPVVGDKLAAVLGCCGFETIPPPGTQRDDPCLVRAFSDLGPVWCADEPGGSNNADSECHE